MAQLVLTAVGSIWGPWGAAIGSAIGGAIDASMQELPDVVGPRIDDKRVQNSSYGATIPYIFGAVRCAGNVIYAEDLEEVMTETEVGGKGGPSQTTITYSYYGTFAVLIGFGPCRGVRRIWADAVLIYDGRIQTPMPPDFDFVFYRGDETQLADPTMEAALGVDQVPGYRGFSYIVFNRMPLERFGNRLPSITVEVLGDGDWSSDETEIGSSSAVRYDGAVQRMDGMLVTVGEPVAGTTRLCVVDPSTGEITLTVDHVGIDIFSSHVVLYDGAVTFVPPTNEVWVSPGNADGIGFRRFDADTLAYKGLIDIGGWNSAVSAYDPTLQKVVVHRSSSQVGSATVALAEVDGFLGTAVDGMFFATQVVTGGSAVFLACGGLHEFGVYSLGSWLVSLLVEHPTPSSGNIGVFDTLRQRFVVFGASGTDGAVWTVTDANPPVITLTTPAGMFGTSAPTDAQYLPGLDVYAVWSSVAGVVILTVIDAETLEVLVNDTSVSANGVTAAFPSLDDPGEVFVLGNYQPYNVQLYGTTVGATVARLCDVSGLVPADYNVSELTQRLRGYLVGQIAAARGAIEQLAKVYFFDGVEQDDLLYFRLRGGATVATISRDECGAGIDDAAEPAIDDTRGQELDLPRRLSLTAPDPARDHQPGTQYAERLARQAGEEESITVATVLTSTEAVRQALTLMFDRWSGRYRLRFATMRKYARLNPTDPVVLDGRRVRIVSRSDEAGVIKFDAVTDDAEVHDQIAAGIDGVFPGQQIAVLVPTNLLLLDIALLRDADDYPGAYVAAYGIAPQWRGGVIYTSADDGLSWTRVATMPKPGSAMGSATNALGNFFGGNVFDELNTLNVSLTNGSASSTTRLGALNGGNALAIESADGWEVLQYRDAVQEADGTWTLSGLLRGRRGTDHAMAGHAAGDRMVLLDTASIRNIEIDSSVIGVERPYRAVSIGATIANSAEQDVTITAERLKPLSPVQLGGGRNAAGDVLLQFRRRTRVGGEWRDSVDASLGEDSEAYEVDIFTTSGRTTVARTITGLSSPAATYTAAQQTTDFGSAQPTVYWAAYQMSETVGRGHVAHGTT